MIRCGLPAALSFRFSRLTRSGVFGGKLAKALQSELPLLGLDLVRSLAQRRLGCAMLLIVQVRSRPGLLRAELLGRVAGRFLVLLLVRSSDDGGESFRDRLVEIRWKSFQRASLSYRLPVSC